MCGFVGVADPRGVDKEQLLKMRDSMIHRGPDDCGVWVSGDGTAALAHRRLAIIDLSSAGNQPMSDANKKHWIAYNGEIYNFQKLREELEREGYRFQTDTDTEVILNSYRQWGKKCLEKFNGMFAFGIYDSSREQFFLARDRLGKKPLYYTIRNGKFIFASELKAIIGDKAVSKELDPQALNFFLALGYVPGSRSIYQSIKKLPPAHAMTYSLKTGADEIWSYWEPPEQQQQCPDKNELLEELESLLENAVRLRMISDVPLGAFLSGGLDSSIVVAMMSRVADRPVKTFSIGFEEEKYNELSYARVVADHFRTDHREIVVKPDSFTVLPLLMRQFDEPFADASMIPTYYLSQATKIYATVALSGDGGDELFGGYTKYAATLGNARIANYFPRAIRSSISLGAALLPDSRKIKRHLLRVGQDPYEAFLDRCHYSYFTPAHRRRILNRSLVDQLGDQFELPENFLRAYLTARNSDFVNCMTYADVQTYLPDDVLVKVDRASMLASLEVRAPLLDYRIAEFAFRKVPGTLKVKRFIGKYLLKELGRKILPPELKIDRKWGFTVPLSEWFRGPLLPRIKEIFFERRGSLFNPAYIETLLHEHNSRVDHGTRLFSLLVFYLWEKENFEVSA